jgi:eukaryotic-like serine/threonine-protein kinase
LPGGGGDIPTAAELGASARFRAVDIGARLGRYEIREELGSGGMATVYRARDTELRRDVALKVLFPHLSKRRDVVARFHREARAAAALDHPSIVRVYDTGGGEVSATITGDGGGGGEAGPRLTDPPYLVMELVEGRSLDQVVPQHAPFLAEIAACIGMLLGSALAEAHRAGIVHRDVKPANVMVTDRGRVALTDFGVARIEGEDASVVTRSGMLLGTPAFMSPEQAAGDKLDERSDIYSLGATLYQLATGAQPYSGSTPRVMAAIVEHKLVPPLQRNPTMGTELARIIERMMAFEPAQRYQRASEAAAALRAVVEHAGMDTEPAAVAQELARFFAEPGAYTASMVPVVVRATLERARDAARRRAVPLALALADRALALDSGCREALTLVERLGAQRSRLRWLAAAGMLVLAGGVSVAGIGHWRQGAAERLSVVALSVGDAGVGNDVAATSSGMAAPGIEPTMVAVSASQMPIQPPRQLSGQPSGESQGPAPAATAPADARDQAERRAARGQEPGQRVESGRRTPAASPASSPGASIDAGPVGRAIEPDVAPPIAPVAAELAPALVTVDIRPWCDLTIDGASHGRARRDRTIELTPGRHELSCSQGPGRAAWRETVILAAGERKHLTGSVLQPVRVRIQVTAGNAVRIAGKRHANGAEVMLAPGRHSIAVLAGEREIGYDWVAIPAVQACTVRDVPALDCYR